MTKIGDQTELLASGVTSPTLVHVPLADKQGTPAGKRMNLRELHKEVAVTYSQTAVPIDDSPSGFYSVQTGTYRGLYWSSGAGSVLQLVSYSEDGPWPVT